MAGHSINTQVHGKWVGFGIEAIHHFVDCVVTDKEPQVTGEDGLEVTKVMCAIEKSAKTDNIVKL